MLAFASDCDSQSCDYTVCTISSVDTSAKSSAVRVCGQRKGAFFPPVKSLPGEPTDAGNLPVAESLRQGPCAQGLPWGRGPVGSAAAKSPGRGLLSNQQSGVEPFFSFFY